MDAHGRSPKVLYVEDDAGLATLYVARFKQEGFDVRYCPDGDQALQVGREFRPDLIVVDLMMPTLSGFDAIEMFRSVPETSGAVIVVMSAMGQQQDIEKARQRGADDYLVKSQVLIDDVIVRLKKHLTDLGFAFTDKGSDEAPSPA
jgi:DNA-binding response OmpR family regulator